MSEGAGACRALMAPFMQILTNATIIAAFGNDHTAMLMYDTNRPGATRARR